MDASNVLIQGLEEVTRTRVKEIAPKAIDDFGAAVRPIYGSRIGHRLTHIGSCILLEIDGKRVLSTAAHIVDQVAQVSLSVGGLVGTQPVPLQGKFRVTRAPGGRRQLDRLDCAYCEITTEIGATLGEVEFLQESRISHNRASPDVRIYTAFGYAVSRNKRSIDHGTGSIRNLVSMYTGHVVEAPELAAQLPHGGKAHLLLNFAKYAYTEEDERVQAFGPKGLSGGALIDLGDFSNLEMYAPDRPHKARLSGMLIEHRKDYEVIIAVKIEAIIEGIRRDLDRR